MPQYYYKALNGHGETEEGRRDADSEQGLVSLLQQEGFIPLQVGVATPNKFLGFDLGDNENRLSQKNIALFTHELAILLGSGVALDKSLSVLMDLAEDNEALKKLIARVLEKIKGGSSLADALESQSGVFSRFYLNMIRAGEAGGNVAAVLNRLSAYLEESKELKSTVITALIYPAILLLMSVASLFVMLVFVVPQFNEMFDNAGMELPFSTQIVVGIANGLQSYWWILALVVIGSSLYMKKQLSDAATKQHWDRRFLQMPLVGGIIQNMETANISRTLGTLLGNGVSLLAALGIAKETVSNLVMAESLENAEQQLKQGKTISAPLLESGCFPKIAMQMIKVGEETGKLEEILLKIADVYDRQLKEAIQRMLALLEPVLIISLGLAIAFIIISILLAIMSVNDLAF